MSAVALSLALEILAGLTVMQTLLIFGAPIGRYAWGGKHRILPVRQRFAAALAVVLYAGFAVLSVLPNLASKSRQQKALQTPVSIALAIGIGLVASGVLA